MYTFLFLTFKKEEDVNFLCLGIFGITTLLRDVFYKIIKRKDEQNVLEYKKVLKYGS